MDLFGKLSNRLAVSSKTIFLVDGIGAVVSAFFLGIILTTFEAFFGMPKWILVILSLIALLFALYSLSCFSRVKQNQRFFLRIIAVSNLIYCLITAGAMLFFCNQLTLFGFIYFLGEISLIVCLVLIEFKVIKQKTPL